jgi:hypothetical protein
MRAMRRYAIWIGVAAALAFAFPPSDAAARGKRTNHNHTTTGGPGSEAVPPLPVRKPSNSAAAATVKEPDEWPAAEIAAARAQCAKILKDIDAVAEPQAPIKKGKCGTPAPIRLMQLGKKAQVTFKPAALLNCEMAAALSKWIGEDVQPLARKHLGARITTVSVMSDYSCRASLGRVGHRLSEHAYADALDIRGFVTAKGENVYVLDRWGETARDVAGKVIAAAPDTKAAAAAIRGKGTQIALPVRRKAASDPLNVAVARLGGPESQAGPKAKPKAEAVASLGVEALPAAAPMKAEAKFLREAHAAACRIFGTTLGPEANEMHRNHLHVDMAARKYKKICD